MLDAFTLHLWATSFATCLRDVIETDIREEGNARLWYTAATVVFIALVTFTISAVGTEHAHLLLTPKGVCESPLFRTVWLFTAMGTVKRHTGAVFGVLPFTIVTFLPLIYVRVSVKLPAFTALYATGFFLCTTFLASRSDRDAVVRIESKECELGGNSYWLAWVSFIMCCIHHSIWIESHDRFQTASGRRVTDHPTSSTALFAAPCPSLVTWLINPKSIQLAIFRTLVVLLSVFTHETPVYFTGWPSVTFLQTLFLFATVSTLAAWTHCQHLEANSLSNILVATVVASTCGILVDSTEQSAYLLVAAAFAIVFEIWG